MPQDLNKAAALKTDMTQPAPSTLQPSPSTDDASAITALTKTAAGTIRQSIGAMNQLAEKVEDQVEQVTDYSADRLAKALKPSTIQAKIAVKTLEKLEGETFIPFELEAIELEEVPRYVPQLPASYAVAALSSSSSSSSSSSDDATSPETISSGSYKTPIPAGTGFGEQRKAS